jgi:hypothetical protein
LGGYTDFVGTCFDLVRVLDDLHRGNSGILEKEAGDVPASSPSDGLTEP